MIKKQFNYDLGNVSYVPIKGICKEFIETDDIQEVKKIIKKIRDIIFLGNCSNILFAFDYSSKIFLKYTGKKIKMNKDYIMVESGCSLSYFSHNMDKNHIDGFYSFFGIPGLLGGSLINNAGCYNKTISDYFLYAICIDKNGKYLILEKKDILFSYHHSNLKEKNVFIYRLFFIKKASNDNLIEKEKCLFKLKTEHQPYELPSLGSTFKNPLNICIGKEIEKMGLKGYNIGNVQISKKHGNFIVFLKKESYENVLKLIERLSLLLYNKLGIHIELEIEIIH